MDGLVNISDFITELESRGLVIVPEQLIKQQLQDNLQQSLRRKALAKKALTYKEIADAKLWGEIGKPAVRKVAEENAKPNELLEVPKGKQRIKKLIIAAVIRIAKQRGQWD